MISTETLRLKASLSQGALQVMNFLNEAVERYPRAISFAPGRPAESLFDVPTAVAQIEPFARSLANEDREALGAAWASLGQYGATNGIIRRLVCDHLRADEHIDVSEDAVMITCGCQEAMLVLLMGLFDEGDVLLVSDPTYIGITGMAQILGVPVEPVRAGPDGLEPSAAARAIARVRESGRRPRALYDIPDFNNPLGTSMPIERRRALLELARAEQVLVFEDNPYGQFAYDAAPLPTLKSFDRDGAVVYLGSFSKTLFPGLRVGYLVADQWVEQHGGRTTLANALSCVKSLTTVNTSPIAQAIVGGVLISHGGSLRALVDAKLPTYRGRRDALLDALGAELGPLRDHGARIRWNRPAGGFFVTLDVPFQFGERELAECAEQYGVLCCPMSFFALEPGRERQIRLAFSYVADDQIAEGIRRLARFVRHKIDA